jgi:hypothetical protein
MSNDEYGDLPELPADFMHMVADHKFELHGAGHHIIFYPNQPTTVHRALQASALAHGARAIEGEPAIAQPTEAELRKDPSSAEYRGAVRAVAESILARNRSSDFGANGKPYANVWEEELGWRPMQSVRDEIWQEVRDAAAVAAKAS